MDTDETALVVLVPVADSIVGEFRQKYDPSAADGMPVGRGGRQPVPCSLVMHVVAPSTMPPSGPWAAGGGGQ
jgi:hypothetical protein